jgi:hypothetical protein
MLMVIAEDLICSGHGVQDIQQDIAVLNNRIL